MKKGYKILIYFEDPGSIFFFEKTISFFKKKKINFFILAKNNATKILSKKTIKYQNILNKDLLKFFLLKEINLVLTGVCQNKNSQMFEILKISKKLHIPSIGLVDTSVNFENRFRGNSNKPLNNKPDYLFVDDKFTKLKFQSIKFESKKVFVIGHSGFSNLFKTSKKMLNKKNIFTKKILKNTNFKDRKKFIFASEFHGNQKYKKTTYDSKYSFPKNKYSNKRSVIIFYEFLKVVKNIKPNPFIILRIHPKDNLKDYKPFLKDIDYVSKDEDPHKLITIADFVVGMTSSFLMEAVILGKKTLSILPKKEEKEWCYSILNSFTPYVDNRKKLKEFISNYDKKIYKKFNEKNKNPELLTLKYIKNIYDRNI